jgi:hypothetical protein
MLYDIVFHLSLNFRTFIQLERVDLWLKNKSEKKKKRKALFQWLMLCDEGFSKTPINSILKDEIEKKLRKKN